MPTSKVIEFDPESAKAYYERGCEKLKKEEFSSAYSDFTQAIKLDPEYANAYIQRGDIHLSLEMYQEAELNYKKAIEIYPNIALPYYKVGNLKYQVELYKEAIEKYSQAINIEPAYLDAIFNRANANYLLGNYNEALSGYEKISAINPKYANLFYFLGRVQNNLNDYEGAIVNLTKAIQISSTDYTIIALRGTVKYKLKDYVGAIIDCTKAIKNNAPTHLAEAYFYRGLAKRDLFKSDINGNNPITSYDDMTDLYTSGHDNIIRRLGYKGTIEKSRIFPNSEQNDIPRYVTIPWDYGGALKDFSKAIELGLKSYDVYFARCKERERIRDYKGAVDDYYILTNYDSYNSELYMAMANAMREDSQYSKAGLYYGQAFELNPKNKLPVFERAKISDYEDAISDYTFLIKECWDVEKMLIARGKVYEGNKEYDMAIADFSKAIQLNPNDAIFSLCAEAKESKNDYQGAIDDYTRAIELNPNYGEYFFYRAMLKDKLKDYSGAILDYTSFIMTQEYPGELPALNNRGIAKARLGDYHGALSDFTTSIENQLNNREFVGDDIDYPDVYNNSGIVKAYLKDYEGAFADFKKVGSFGTPAYHNIQLLNDSKLGEELPAFQWIPTNLFF